MDTSPLVLSPSGNAEVTSSQSAFALPSGAANPTGDDSTFAGALRNAAANGDTSTSNAAGASQNAGNSNGANASSGANASNGATAGKSAAAKPSRKSTSKDADDTSGSALPVTGNHAPPNAIPVPPISLPGIVPQSATAADALASGAATEAKVESASAADADQLAATTVSAAATESAAAGGEPGGADDSSAVAAAATPAVATTIGPASAAAEAGAAPESGTANQAAAANQANAAALNAAFAAPTTAASAAGTVPDAQGAVAATGRPVSAAASASVLGAAAATVGGQTAGKTPLAATRAAPVGSSLSARRLADPGTNGDAAAIDPASDASSAGVPVGAAPTAPLAANIADGPGALGAAQASNASVAAGDPAPDTIAAGSDAPGPAGIVASTTIAIAASHAAAAVASAQSAIALAATGKHVQSTDAAAAPATAGSDAAAGVFQLTAPASVAQTTETALPTLQVHANVDSSEFAQGLSERVTYMVDNGLNGAKLQVNPPQLGPIELRIAVTGSHAQVWMTTHSAVTRDALEVSAPKLREMLGAQGFGQVSVDISQRSFQDRSTYAQPYQAMASSAFGGKAAAATASVGAATTRPSLRGLDAYA